MSSRFGNPPTTMARPSLMATFRPPVVRQTDWINPLVMLALAVAGVVFIKSAQSFYGGTQWKQQIVWLVLGTGVYVTVAAIDYHVWFKNARWVYLAGLALLLLIFTGLGETRSGARRWLGFGAYTLQPSEFAKIGTLIMVAALLARSELGTVRESLRVLGQVGAAIFVPIVLIFLQPDLGSSLVIFPMVFAQLFVSNLSARFFVTVFGVFVLVVGLVGVDIYGYHHFLQERKLTPHAARGQYEKVSWLPLKDYQRERIASFIAPEVVDPQGIGVTWNQNQSLLAVGSGGVEGKGYGNGTQARLGYLPSKVATSDFFMAVLLEESGFLGGLAVLGLFAILLGNTLRIAAQARDRFGQLLAVGVAAVLVVHVFVNIGMVQGLMPIKGIPLPLMSYGGTFVLACGILLGLVQSVHRFRREAI